MKLVWLVCLLVGNFVLHKGHYVLHVHHSSFIIHHFNRRWPLILFSALTIFFQPGNAFALEGQLNLNTASAKELQKLPFIGKARAEAIVDYRNTHGPFKSLEDVVKSSDIGQKTFEAIKPYLRLSGKTTIAKDKASPRSTAEIRTIIMSRPGEIVILSDKKYYDNLIQYIKKAKKTIHMAMFIFKITDSPKNRPALVLKELINAGKRGVSIRVILEKSGYDDNLNLENRRVAKKLKKHRIAVFFDSPDITTHTKLVVIDSRYSFVGSHNLTHSALAYNHEFSLLIDNKTLARKLIGYMKTIDR